MFRSIDRSLRPTGRMPWITLRLWRFLYVRDAEVTKSLLLLHCFFFFFYAERVLGALGLNLELKARVYEAPTLSSLFLLNNYNYIAKTLQRYEYCMNTKLCLLGHKEAKHELSELSAVSSDWRTCHGIVFLDIGRSGKVAASRTLF